MAADGSTDDVLALLAVRRGWIDERQREQLAETCRAAPGSMGAHLRALGVSAEDLHTLEAEVAGIEQRTVRVTGTGPRPDRIPDDVGQATIHEPVTPLDGVTIHEVPSVPPDAPRLGRYPVTGRLGVGGMGEVLAVLDLPMGRVVAAKVIRGQPDENALRKFVQEARITGQLEHPSIVPAHELGRTPDGQLYLTMKRVEGKELAALVAEIRRERAALESEPTPSGARRRPRASVAENERTGLPHGLLQLLRVFGKICEGVAFAHSKGVIHRDLKPANVMVGAYGEVLVMDWGLARVQGEAIDADPSRAGLLPDLSRSSEDALRTLDGTVMGTPAYMPPEQAEGQLALIDERADVYALGAILYELLALAPPYEGADPWAVLAQVRAGPPPPPTERVAGAWVVPWELEGVVQRAMERRRDERYGDVRSLAADVEAFLAGRTVSAVQYTRWQLASKFARRHWRSVSAAAVALVSLVAALSYGAISARRETAAVSESLLRVTAEQTKTAGALTVAERERRRAEDERQRAEANLSTAHGMGAAETLGALRRGAELELWWTPLARVEDDLRGDLARPPTRGNLEAVIKAIADWDDVARALIGRREEFATALESLDATSMDPWIRLQRRVYVELADGTSEIEKARSELAARQAAYVERRDRPVDAELWAAVTARLRDNPHYAHGLVDGRIPVLGPQVDLVPIGPDPASGLEEFLHLGSGSLTKRGQNGTLTLTDDGGIVLVLIPTGRYSIGATTASFATARPNEAPVHTVDLDAYFLGKTELTQAQWVALGGMNPSRWRAGQAFGPAKVTARHPVDQASWTETVALLGRHGLVLPTERQWEAAAGGGTTDPWWTGPDPAALATAENVADATARQFLGGIGATDPWSDGHFITSPVGRFTPARPHPFGLHDVVGNIREWCRDVYAERSYEDRDLDRDAWHAPTGRLPNSTNRTCRGGCWDQESSTGRTSSRGFGAPGVRSPSLGCRVSRSLTP